MSWSIGEVMHRLQSSVAGARGMIDLGEGSRSQHPVEYEGQERSKRQGSSEQSLGLRVGMTGLSPTEVPDSAEAASLTQLLKKLCFWWAQPGFGFRFVSLTPIWTIPAGFPACRLCPPYSLLPRPSSFYLFLGNSLSKSVLPACLLSL